MTPYCATPKALLKDHKTSAARRAAGIICCNGSTNFGCSSIKDILRISFKPNNCIFCSSLALSLPENLMYFDSVTATSINIILVWCNRLYCSEQSIVSSNSNRLKVDKICVLGKKSVVTGSSPPSPYVQQTVAGRSSANAKKSCHKRLLLMLISTVKEKGNKDVLLGLRMKPCVILASLRFCKRSSISSLWGKSDGFGTSTVGGTISIMQR